MKDFRVSHFLMAIETVEVDVTEDLSYEDHIKTGLGVLDLNVCA